MSSTWKRYGQTEFRVQSSFESKHDKLTRKALIEPLPANDDPFPRDKPFPKDNPVGFLKPDPNVTPHMQEEQEPPDPQPDPQPDPTDPTFTFTAGEDPAKAAKSAKAA